MEIKIKNIDDALYKQLKLKAGKEGGTINELIIEALKSYVSDKDLQYKKELFNFEEDECYQEPDQ